MTSKFTPPFQEYGDNSKLQETLNIDRALLVKLFGRQADEMQRFRQRSTAVADIGVR